MNFYKYLLFFSLSVVVFACNNNQSSQLLVRKWRITFDVQQRIKNMTKEEKELYDKVPEKEKKEAILQMEKEASKNLFEFRNDGTFEVVLGDEIVKRGKWQLSQDGKKLTLTTKISETEQGLEELVVKELNENKLVINDTQGNTVLTPLSTN